MNVELHFIDKNGVDQGVLPDYTSVNISPVFCDYGTLEFSYAPEGLNFALPFAADEFEIAVWLNGAPAPELNAWFRDSDGDDIGDGDYKFTGQGFLCLLDDAVVFPNGWPSFDPKDPSKKFTTATAGTIMQTLVQEAKARGALTGVDVSTFTAAKDSNGVNWTKTISIEFKPGVKYSDVLKTLYAQGMAEFKMVGRSLRMYVADSLTVDRTLQADPLVFRKGRDLKDSPRRRSTRDVATVVLAAGKDDVGLYHEEVDATAVAARRRIETFISNGNVSDPGTLEAFSEATLSQLVAAKMEKSHGLEFVDDNSPRPLTNFNVGDWAWSDTNGTLERLRIKQWVLSAGSDGSVTGSVVLNDLFAEAAERLSKRIDGIVGGSTLTGESRAVDAVPEAIVDMLAPKVPTGLALASSAYTNQQGQTWAQITASWSPVTQNADGTAIDDLGRYELMWWNAATPTQTSIVDGGEGTATSWSPVQTGQSIQVIIRAVDKVGNASAWSTPSVGITSAVDSTPPPVPSQLTMDPYLGLIRGYWNGKGSAGESMSADTKYVEIHASSVTGFTPSDTTLIDHLTTAGSFIYEAPYGQARYFKARSVDFSNNKSAGSVESTATSAQLVRTDLQNNIIDFSAVSFKDAGNLIEDGGFRLTDRTAARVAQSNWPTSTDADGMTAMRWVPGVGDLTLMTGVQVTPGEKLVTLFSWKGTANAGAVIAVYGIWKNLAGTTLSTTALSTGGLPVAGWSKTSGVYATVPASAATVDVFVRVTGGTSGNFDIDNIEVRRVIGTSIIDDAAITSAKIANLAVNDAHIANLNVGKLVAGTMIADVIMGGRFATALTGLRVEVNALGLQKFAADGTLLVNITGTDALLTGMYRTAVSGRRIEMGAGGTVGSLKFYSADGDVGNLAGFTADNVNGVEALRLEVPQPGITGNGGWNGITFDQRSQVMILSDSHLYQFGRDHAWVVSETQEIAARGTAGSKDRLRISSDGIFYYEYGTADPNTKWEIYNNWFAIYGNPQTNRPSWRKSETDGYLINTTNVTGVSQVYDADGSSSFNMGGTKGWVKFQGNGGTVGGSAELVMTNGNNFAGILKYYYLASDTGGQRFEMRDSGDANYIGCWATNFTVNSDREGKTNISEPISGALAKVRTMKARTFDRKAPNSVRNELGFVADEMPDEVRRGTSKGAGGRGEAVDVMATLALLTAAVQEIDERMGQ